VVKLILKRWTIPLVLDADGLNNVGASDLKGHPSLIITPHPGEMARLMHFSTKAVGQDRVGMAGKIAREQKLCCVLKGHHTVITDGKTTRINPTGNPAMATGGMGDVLTGVVGGLLAQGVEPFDAACAGAYLHGLAGDLVQASNRGLLASEVAGAIPQALAKIGVR
jgi:NAD(P)H-hydrate epimerase